MIRVFAAMFVLTVTLTAAPVPKAPEYKLKGWGDPLDPMEDCKFDVADGKLTMTIPGKARDMSIHRGKLTAPRVLQEYEGDFTIQVKIDGEWPLGATLDAEGRPVFFAAGLFITTDDKNYIRLEKAMFEQNGKVTCYVNFEHWQDGEFVKYGSLNEGEWDRKTALYAKLERKGNAITAYQSNDGKQWTALNPLPVKFDSKMKIGVSAVHSTKSEFKPIFSDLAIQKLEAK